MVSWERGKKRIRRGAEFTEKRGEVCAQATECGSETCIALRTYIAKRKCEERNASVAVVERHGPSKLPSLLRASRVNMLRRYKEQ
jgi:hypothetical protein